MKRVSVFVVAVILITGIIGCAPTPVQYTLTISSTEGGDSSCVPAIGCTCGEGTESSSGLPVPEECVCAEGTEVTIVATPDPGYCFIGWTGDVDTLDDVDATETTILINDNYSVTANFVPDGAEPIWDWYDLDAIRDNLGGNYSLMNHLDFTTAGYEELASDTANDGKGWKPIGTDDDPFTGTLDGQGFEITDLFVNRPTDESFVGLFGFIVEGGMVGNLGMVNAIVTGDVGVGGLVGMNFGIVSNSYSAGSVSGYDAVGGLVGLNGGNTSYCYSNAGVTGTGSTTAEVSGVGGLVGTNYVHISYCYSTGSVTGVSPVGGLVGVDYFGSVSHSYSTASVIGDLGVGGLVGLHALGAVNNSYATGSVTGTSYVGGLVGANSFNGTVNNSYSCGSVTGGDSIGGLVGFKHDAATVSSSFWDTQASGQATSAGGTGKTTAEMHDIITFSGASWNIAAVANPSLRNPSYIWNIVDDETYPLLSWEPVS